LMAVLLAYYLAKYHRPEILQREIAEFIPKAAWLRAGIFFCLFYVTTQA